MTTREASAVKKVAVIGAGYAGLACAVELTRRGHQVTVFERSHVLGGRARRVAHSDYGVDNGQHILLGAYHELQRLMRVVGASPRALRRVPLTLHLPGHLHLRAARLPAPLHLLWAGLSARGLSVAERVALYRFSRYLQRQQFELPATLSVHDLLQQAAQPERLVRLIWEPLCLAALNTPIEVASAAVFACVLRDVLHQAAVDSEMLIPRLDLSELFPVPAVRYLGHRRAKVHTGNAIAAIIPQADGFQLQGDPSEMQRYDDIVIATAPYHASVLLDQLPECVALSGRIRQFTYQPITTLYLLFDQSLVLPAPIFALVDGWAQWVIVREQEVPDDKTLLAAVISAHADQHLPERDALIKAVCTQLEQALAQVLPPPQWQMVICEKRATYACVAGVERPAAKTPHAGVWLAGDYLAGPYPATLESAVRAGGAVARAIATNADETVWYE